MFLRSRKAAIGPPPDCSKYKGLGNLFCKLGLDACSKLTGTDNAACSAAVGACIPAAVSSHGHAHAWKHGRLNGTAAVNAFNEVAGHMIPCVNAAMKVSPKGAAQLLHGKIPDAHKLAPFFQNAEARQNVHNLSQLVPDGMDWGFDFGRDLTR